jgi:acetyl-CoA carboxylase carboxyltransferase component
MDSSEWLQAAVHGAVIGIEVASGEVVAAGQTLLVQEAMKMELPLRAPFAGRVQAISVAVGDVVPEGTPLLALLPLDAAALAAVATVAAGPDAPAPASGPSTEPAPPRADLLALQARWAQTQDAARPEAVARRHAAGRCTAREVVAALLDPGSFSEYGGLAVAAQRSRRSLPDLQAHTPADGQITGTGTVAGLPVAVLVYDYTVLAGTQGVFNHHKSDRLLALAAQHRWPVLLWAEGGGGRPGDVDWLGVAGLDCTTFARFAALSGQVPLVGIAAGRCFAGNAALLGCCDVIIATESSSLGMGGPAMIQGGGLGQVDADAVGPVAVLAPAGVVDLRVADDDAAIAMAQRVLAVLSLGQQPAPHAAGGDTLALRHALPANRNALYDPRPIVHTVMDAGSVVELRRDFGTSLITALARLQGRAVAVVASQPHHLGGALDAPACDKLARFMQLADAHGLPLITLVDTPGFMVGPASEATAMVRHAARVFVTAAALRVPVLSVVLRRGYGLGAMALTAGHFHAPVATCAWPSGEFGAMGLEGAVRLGFSKELAAAAPAERAALFERLLAQAQTKGQALNMASFLEVDEVIDPAATRDWLARHLAVACAQPLPPRRGFIDPW